ncbi:MAG: F0F1 ATP synthase subunit B [Planctomycetota bacterium]
MDQIADYVIANVDSFLWSLAAFVLFVLVILKFAVRPVVAGLDARDKRIRDELAASEQALLESRAAKEEFERKLAEAEGAVADMLAKARSQADEHKDAILSEGRGEVERLRARALRDIDNARAQAVQELRLEMVDVATAVAARIIEKQLDPAQHEELALSAIDELRTQGLLEERR